MLSLEAIEALMIEEYQYRKDHPCCENCSRFYIDYGMPCCKKHEEPMEDITKERCEDFIV